MIRTDLLELVSNLRAKGEPFALATVVRTVAATAAKAGAKAIIRDDGVISAGWIGGGCARGAVLRAARDAIKDGEPRLISVQPKDLLDQLGVAAGEAREGIEFAKNMCPSRGTMDIFVEPVLPHPQIVILGSSPVGVALADLAQRFGFFVIVCAPASDHADYGEVDVLADGFEPPGQYGGAGFIVVATQGKGDSAALKAALKASSAYVAFVGSRKKAEALRQELAQIGFDAERLKAFKAPAGLDIGAITPDEIAFSILAEIIEARRRGHRSELQVAVKE
ncbi:XdhC family protein [Methylocapsa polymorpha]|uniref:XdhC family protein n=1 Tax=Methylocapsa polymorpha TaxID=3080828 RepID=A0ABZ0HVZ5_9HYPH|nr:XdhC family protein [Methylocapsa sp. RX1]